MNVLSMNATPGEHVAVRHRSGDVTVVTLEGDMHRGSEATL